MKLNVIYSLSTLPFFKKNPNGSFEMDKFELYTAALSSLTRKSKQEISPKDGLCSSDGRILTSGNTTIMHCDKRGAEYLRAKGVSDLWDEVLEDIPDDLEGINPLMFWAAGKLFALKNTKAPVLMLDTDFIAWQLPELGSSIVAAHREPLFEKTYPDVSRFQMNDSYTFNDKLDYTVQPLNTAFLYMNDDEFKDYYVEQSLDFMKSALPCDDYLTYMVYAEQRLLALLAAYKNIDVKTILCYEQLRLPQKRYTHTWGAKQVMRDNPSEEERFCEKCRNRIRKDFPKYEYIIDIIG
ncbi:MAG: hypothetical protein FWF94_06595 [Oscillospiraceae bacterium]|nr:hypothetical protein [Oscillospiraceae bacterium]